MPTYSQAPAVAKGRLRVYHLPAKKPQVITFQYNPATLSRSLQPPVSEPSGNNGQRAVALRYKGAPTETFNLDIEINAADQLELGNQQAHNLGILPQLAVLEMLLYPPSSDVKLNDKLLDQGQIEVASGYDAPFTLLEWGKNRTVPVTITSLSITEELFDKNLNPLVASVKLGLKSLSYSDLIRQHRGYSDFVAYQQGKEQLALKAG